MGTTTFNGTVRSETGFSQITKNSTTGVITENTTIDSHHSLGNFQLFPNPANDFIFIAGTPNKACSINLINVLGEIVLKQNLDSNQEIIEQKYPIWKVDY